MHTHNHYIEQYICVDKNQPVSIVSAVSSGFNLSIIMWLDVANNNVTRKVT